MNDKEVSERGLSNIRDALAALENVPPMLLGANTG